MKFSAILLCAASGALATPVFWGHPNVQVSLDAPQLSFGQVIDLNLGELTTQNPQNQVWFTGGLVGYFVNEWDAPIWTVPWLDWRLEPRESEAPLLFPHFDPPVAQRLSISDPPDPARFISQQNVQPPGPSPTDTRRPDPPLPDIRRLDVNPDPPAVNETPEPNLSAILAVLLALVFSAASLRTRPR
jgi:hypothetical protein